jgi:hypothetical protein
MTEKYQETMEGNESDGKENHMNEINGSWKEISNKDSLSGEVIREPRYLLFQRLHLEMMHQPGRSKKNQRIINLLQKEFVRKWDQTSNLL